MYDYFEAVKNDIIEYIENNVNRDDYEDREEMEQALNDELWTEDSVTGNGSGSYTMSRAQAKQYFFEAGSEYLLDMISDFGLSAEEIGKRIIAEDWEWFDVSIRCYLLVTCLSYALDDLTEAGYFAEL